MDSLGPEDIILFLNKASIQFAATIIRMWSLKGHQPEIFTYGGRLRQHLIGAVDPIEGKAHIAFSDGLKAIQFQHFLEGLLARNPKARKIVATMRHLNRFMKAGSPLYKDSK